MGLASLRIKHPAMQGGITYAQAMEVIERYCAKGKAAPSVAREMSLDIDVVCDVLDGKIWPQARQFWLDHAVVVSG